MVRQLVCITCPMGCHLSVEKTGDTLAVSGNRCARGVKYAEEELLSPKRVVSATCKASRPDSIRVPCRTDSGFPKEAVPELLKAVYGLTVKLPVKRGDILLAKALGTDVNVIATRTVV